MFTYKKAIDLGDEVEILDFEKAIWYGEADRKPKGKGHREICEAEKEQNRQRNRRRSKTTYRRLVKLNAFKWKNKYGRPYLPIFITLTFAGSMTDVDIANGHLTKFIQRLNYELRDKTDKSKKNFLKYLGVVEFQEDVDYYGKVKPLGGSVHYHIMFFNLPKMERIYDRLREIWGFGAVNVESIYNTRGATVYLTKYMLKQDPSNRLAGKKVYFASKGLNKPQPVYNQEKATAMEAEFQTSDKTFEKTFDTDNGKITYKIYKRKGGSS